MRHDMRLRAAARAIFDAVYPSDHWSPCRFDEAERFNTVHYRQAVGAKLQARAMLSADTAAQLELI